MPDTPKTLSLADFTKETKELETKLPNMSEAERKAVADKLLADQKTLSAADQAKLATMISEQADISNGQMVFLIYRVVTGRDLTIKA